MTPEILVIFTADWCQSCKTLKGLLETPEFKHIEVQFIDADVNPEICPHDRLTDVARCPRPAGGQAASVPSARSAERAQP